MEMLTIDAKRALTQLQTLTLEGQPIQLAGYGAPMATLTGDFPGFWTCSWDVVQEVVAAGGAFLAAHVRLDHRSWLGSGAPLPQALQRKWR